jgi:delta 1-pyrroline-5-carboxylate dehydrogenase
MKIDHLINGKPVAGRDYFETVNPATQEVLAEVAEGGEAEVELAVAAAKEAFPKWAAMPAPQRAKLVRKLGDLREGLAGGRLEHVQPAPVAGLRRLAVDPVREFQHSVRS